MKLLPVWNDMRISSAVLTCIVALSGCGGGGGDGGGGAGRTTETAVRMIHASIDGAPLTASIPGLVLQKARFAELTSYVPLQPGGVNITVERVNSPGVTVGNISAVLAEDTEYTLFVHGSAQAGTIEALLLTEPVERPEEGTARVQLLNGYIGSSGMELRGTGFGTPRAAEGASSGFITVPSGVQQISVVDERGRTIQSAAITLEDRGEATVVISGSRDLGISFLRTYVDLD